MIRITETFVNLGLLRAESVTTEREPSELADFSHSNEGEQLEILANAEQVVLAGINYVHQAPYSSQDTPTRAA